MKLVKHKLVLTIEYVSAEGWESANAVAMRIGEKVLRDNPEVLEVDGSVDPEVKVDRRFVYREIGYGD